VLSHGKKVNIGDGLEKAWKVTEMPWVHFAWYLLIRPEQEAVS
jgi:hypothetical protein